MRLTTSDKARAGFLAGTVLLVTLSGCAGVAADAPDTAGAAESTRPLDEFGPEGFGKLTLDMTEQQALATGDLGASPVAVESGCRDYSFVGGPSPDPDRMARDAKLEKRYRAAEKAADETERKADKKLPRDASAQEYAESAQAAADSAEAASTAIGLSAQLTQRAAERTEAFTEAGGATFGKGGLKALLAPPAARTAAGISRGATVEQLRAAYAPQGLTSSDGRFEMPAAGRPGWSMAFNVEGGKVTSYLLLNRKIDCA